MNTPRPSQRAGKRRIATRFALAGALTAAPIALTVGAAQAATTATHHDNVGALTPLPEPDYAAPGPEQVPTSALPTYTLTVY